MTTIYGQLQELVSTFGDVATADPLSTVLLAVGAVLLGAASGAFGYLSLRGVIAVLSGPPGRGPPRQAR